MRRKSPELMSEIKKYIEDYYLQNRQSPSTTKIAEAVGIVLSCKLDAPVLCRLDAPDFDVARWGSADCLHQHQQVI